MLLSHQGVIPSEPRPASSNFEDAESQKIKSELIELNQVLQAKDKVIEFLSSRLEKERNKSQTFIQEDQVNKSASMKCLLQ